MYGPSRPFGPASRLSEGLEERSSASQAKRQLSSRLVPSHREREPDGRLGRRGAGEWGGESEGEEKGRGRRNGGGGVRVANVSSSRRSG